jgi:hypothetical protein
MYFDVAMPMTLFFVTIVAIFFEEKVEKKLKVALEEREFRVWDAVLLVAAISVTVFLIILIPQMVIMVFFLFSYSMLLFIFTYIFSNFQKAHAKLFITSFLIVTFLAAIISLFNFDANSMVAYGTLALFGLFGFTFMTLLYEERRASTGERWYLAILPPALFILLYLFYGRTPVWFPFLLDLYGLIFAVLIILYLGSLFAWKTTLIFAGLLIAMDIVLVLFTGTMVSAATHVSGLRLPILVSLPTVPTIMTEEGTLYMGLGLGDFFFAGLLATQTYKKFGKDLALVSIIAMSVSFFIFEAVILNYGLSAFPGTLMIICGWLPAAAIGASRER